MSVIEGTFEGIISFPYSDFYALTDKFLSSNSLPNDKNLD